MVLFDRASSFCWIRHLCLVFLCGNILVFDLLASREDITMSEEHVFVIYACRISYHPDSFFGPSILQVSSWKSPFCKWAVEGRSNQQHEPLRGQHPQFCGRAHRSTTSAHMMFTSSMSVHPKILEPKSVDLWCFLVLVFLFLFPLRRQPKFGVYGENLFRPPRIPRLPCRSARSSGQKDCQRPI